MKIHLKHMLLVAALLVVLLLLSTVVAANEDDALGISTNNGAYSQTGIKMPPASYGKISSLW